MHIAHPHGGYDAKTVTAFVYKTGVGEESHAVEGEAFSTYLVCPECDAVLGSPNVDADF